MCAVHIHLYMKWRSDNDCIKNFSQLKLPGALRVEAMCICICIYIHWILSCCCCCFLAVLTSSLWCCRVLCISSHRCIKYVNVHHPTISSYELINLNITCFKFSTSHSKGTRFKCTHWANGTQIQLSDVLDISSMLWDVEG